MAFFDRSQWMSPKRFPGMNPKNQMHHEEVRSGTRTKFRIDGHGAIRNAALRVAKSRFAIRMILLTAA